MKKKTVAKGKSVAPKSTAAKEKTVAPSWLRWLSPLLCVAGVLAFAIGLLAYEDEYLWKVQELNLHLDTSLFFRQQMVVPGGLLTWMGTYFTEFFYHPLLGVGWLCLWWAALMLLASKAFRVPVKWSVVLLVPIALLLLTCVDLGYWIYYLKLRGHFFVATIGLCVTCGQVWAFRVLPARRGLRPLFIALSTLIAFPLTGFYALLAALLMGVMGWRLQGDKPANRITGSVVALLAIVAVPLICYRTVFYQTSMENIWWAALPLFRIIEEHSAYYIPYYLLVAFFLSLAISYGLCATG